MQAAAPQQNWFHRTADRIERRFFGIYTELAQDQLYYFQSIFTPESSELAKNLAKYFKQELCIGFTFNILLLTVLVTYIPLNFMACWNCNAYIAAWFLFLSLLNAIAIIPKALLISKLLRTEEVQDVYLANFVIWSFFKSKPYKFNTILSKYVLCTYLAGLFLAIKTEWVDNDEYYRFYWVVNFFLGFFVVRLISGFLKFIRNFQDPQQAESLIDLFSGNSWDDIKTLKEYNYGDYKIHLQKDNNECPICYDRYNDTDSIRVMKCQGTHVFHKICIDKWLMRSDRCPQCNLSVFWKDELEKKKK